MWMAFLLLSGLLVVTADVAQDVTDYNLLQTDFPLSDTNDEERIKREYLNEKDNPQISGGNNVGEDGDDGTLVAAQDSNLPDEFKNALNKRFISIFRNRPPKSEGYKRGPGFRSWGGKRQEHDLLKRQSEFTLPYEPMSKRTLKRRPFQSWGGKRSFLYNYPLFTRQTVKQLLEGKRKFNSWGGKRNNQEEDQRDTKTGYGEQYQWQQKRASGNRKFQSWGGKRDAFDSADFE